MSGAETARRRVVQRQIGGAETAAPKWPSPEIRCVPLLYLQSGRRKSCRVDASYNMIDILNSKT